MAIGGPVLIVAAVLVVLHEFVLHDQLSAADVRTYWLPTYCFLGKNLAQGHIPLWNPHTMSGTPFAAGPQSGWMYLPPMVLFSALSCGAAIRSMIVLQPLLAGLGLFSFLRSEGLSRPSATSGGLALGLSVAGSTIALSLPFAGTLGWTAVLLACASRYFRARTWSSRLVWCLLTAAAWGQLAAAHMSVGLLMGTGTLAFYLVAKSWEGVKRRGLARSDLAVLMALLVGAMLVVNLAYFLPRLNLVPRTSLSLGYGKLQELGQQLAGVPVEPPAVGRSSGIRWPLKLATSPGAHLGALALALMFGAWWNARRRHLAAAFTAYAALAFLLTLGAVARQIPESMRDLRVIDFYLHAPEWFGYIAILCLAVLAALGIQAWMDAGSARERLLMAVPGILVWGLLPPILGAGPVRLAPLWIGAALGALALVATARRPGMALLVPIVLAIELVANGLLPGSARVFPPFPQLLGILSRPTVDLSEFLEPGPIARLLQATPEGRYVAGGRGRSPRGSRTSGLEVLNRALLFRIRSAEGYDPVQLLRYWTFVRASQRALVSYNRAIFRHPSPVALDLLDIRYLLGGITSPPLPELTPVVDEGPATLYMVPAQPAAPASVVPTWAVVDSPERALSEVLSAGFDPAQVAILEEEPGLETAATPASGSSSPSGSSLYRAVNAERAIVLVDAPRPSILLVRTPYDPGWRATVDGRPVRVLPANYVAQAVPVPAGRHTVHLIYRDPWIGWGALASAFAVTVMLGAAFFLRRRTPTTTRGANNSARAAPEPSSP